MNTVFTYGLRYKYPHMKPADVKIWESFIKNNPDAYDTVIYDLCVGSPPSFDSKFDAVSTANAVDLYKKKIDVVGFKGNTVDIIELKPNAGAGALGQVLGYVILYKRDISDAPTPRPVLITDSITLDMEELALKLGVRLIVAP